MNCSLFSVRKFDYVNHHYAPRHKHAYYEINCYIGGSGYTVINGKKYSFSASSLTLVPPNVQHDETFTASGEVICILFESDEVPFVCPEPLIVLTAESPIFTYAKLMFKEATEKRDNYSYINSHLIKVLITEIHRMLQSQTDRMCKTLSDIKNHISENFYKKLSFTELADMSGYSYDYFRHIFKERYGVSPQNYLISVRLENAYAILSSTPNISMTEVANTCGFSDSAQFSTMFTKAFGISPKKFQKQAEKKV